MDEHGKCGPAAWALLFFSLCVTSLAGAQPLTTGGTGAATGTIQVLAEEYQREQPSFTLAVVDGLGSTNEATQKFLDFVSSEKGRMVLVRLGHLVPSAQ